MYGIPSRRTLVYALPKGCPYTYRPFGICRVSHNLAKSHNLVHHWCMSQMHTYADLAENLVDRMHRAMRISDMSTQELADKMGVHRNSVRNYLTGRRQPNRPAHCLGFATGVPLTWLETGHINGDPGEPSPVGLGTNNPPVTRSPCSGSLR